MSVWRNLLDFTYKAVATVAVKEDDLHFLLDDTVGFEEIRLIQRARWCIARCNNDFNQMAFEASKAADEISNEYLWAMLEYVDFSTDAKEIGRAHV